MSEKGAAPGQPEGTPAKAPTQDPYGTTIRIRWMCPRRFRYRLHRLIFFRTDSDEVLESYAEVYHYPADIFHG